jgi:hypothetical protein
MREQGLNNADELMAYIAKHTQNNTGKQRKGGYEM